MATSISYSENHLDPTKRVPESSPLVISDDGNFANLHRISHNEKKYYNSPDFMFPLVAIFTLLVFVESLIPYFIGPTQTHTYTLRI